MSESKNSAVLQARLTPAQKRVIQRAAKLRGLALSDYVRLMLVSMANQELEAAKSNVIALTRDEQIQLWNALNAPAKLTPANRKLGAIMRGEA